MHVEVPMRGPVLAGSLSVRHRAPHSSGGGRIVPGILQQLQSSSGGSFTVDFGVRSAAIVIVVITSLVLGNWARRVISRIPIRGSPAAEHAGHPGRHFGSMRTVSSRALGIFAYLCVLLAGLIAIIAIVNYGQPGATQFDPTATLRTFQGFAKQIVTVLLLVPATLAAGRFLQRGAIHGLPERVDSSLRALWGRLVYVAVLICGALVILAVLGVPLALPVAFLGVITLALSLALQDVLRNLFAGVYLLVERPFVIGDDITVNGFAGQIEDIHLRVTSLLARDGHRVLVPNSILFTSTVINATAQDRWPATLTLTLPITEATDFRQLEERIVATLAQVQDVRQKPAPSVVLRRAGQGKLEVSVELWVTGAQEATQAVVSEAITQLARAFSEAEVSVAAATAPS
jgi:small-conductance mechanosensitive channel